MKKLLAYWPLILGGVAVISSAVTVSVTTRGNSKALDEHTLEMRAIRSEIQAVRESIEAGNVRDADRRLETERRLSTLEGKVNQ